MKLSLQVFLWLIALLLFGIQAVLTAAGGNSGKINLMAIGACFFVAGFLFG